jgi:hypothetical protein
VDRQGKIFLIARTDVAGELSPHPDEDSAGWLGVRD